MAKGRGPRPSRGPGPGPRPRPSTDRLWRAHIDWLFLETMADIAVRSQRRDLSRYQTLGLAPLLRKLLVDHNPLLHQVNRPHQLKLTFSARQYDPGLHEPPPGYSPEDVARLVRLQLECLDPAIECHGGESVVQATLPQWLKQDVGVDAGVRFTVRDVIQQIAHVEGGVHVGKPRTQREQALFMLSMKVADRHELGLLGLLAAIGRVTVTGVQPLADAVKMKGGG